jgi:Uma2 family endonuclease
MPQIHEAPRALRPSLPSPSARGEQRFVVNGVSWKDYMVLREALDIPGLRMAYLQGQLELMTPSPEHEDQKKTIARLVECYALERNVAIYGYGNATFRKAAKERGAEPDECWVVGRKLVEFPDIALEVVLSSGGIDKLAIYQGFGVPEVWFWEGDGFHLHALRDGSYVDVERSSLLPDLDFEVVARFVRLGDQHEAARAYREWLRAEPA